MLQFLKILSKYFAGWNVLLNQFDFISLHKNILNICGKVKINTTNVVSDKI